VVYADSNYGCSAMATCTCPVDEVLIPTYLHPVAADVGELKPCGHRRATTGYAVFLAGGPVCFRSKVQACTAKSTSEAEYMAAGATAQEVVWVRRCLKELGWTQDGATTIFEDNQGCLDMVLNPVAHGRTKHIDITYHFVRELVQAGEVKFQYVRSQENVADIFTKPLDRVLFQRFSRLLLTEC